MDKSISSNCGNINSYRIFNQNMYISDKNAILKTMFYEMQLITSAHCFISNKSFQSI